MCRRGMQRRIFPHAFGQRRRAAVCARETGDERALPIDDGARVETETLRDDFVSLLVQQPRVDRDAITARAIKRNRESLLRVRRQFDSDAARLAVAAMAARDLDDGVEA